jgi:uncharacterized membrane protein
MLGYTWIQWLFFFFFYSFFGWCFESTYVSLHEKRFVNRGFIRGPFLPLYGTGALMMLIVSMPFRDNLILTYVAGCVGATVLEYITGVLMETLFKVRYWDYSHKKFNFQGQICLESSLAWGLLTILMTRIIHKPIEAFALWLPSSVLTGVTMVVTVRPFLQGGPGFARCTGSDGAGQGRTGKDAEASGCDSGGFRRKLGEPQKRVEPECREHQSWLCTAPG